jgi:6-phosphofructokinase
MNKMAIVVGGGPAPGINSVIAAATIEAERSGIEVVGIRDGFGWIMRGDTSHVAPLTAEGVASAHFRGGSIIGTGRANPTVSQELLATTLQSLAGIGADKLMTIGGDDTAFTALRLAQQAGRAGLALRVVHVPKTIDNDLELPPLVDTFGFDTACHLAADLGENIARDAAAMSRWFFLIAMGRKAGHLALGLGAAIGATITLVAEEWPEGTIPLREIVDQLVGSMVKRQALGHRWGVAVIAEGIVERLPADDLEQLGELARDQHGNVRLGEIDIGDLFKSQVEHALAALGTRHTIVTKEIGYELRCQDPTARDKIYGRELGYCAARLLLDGGQDVMVSIVNGEVAPIALDQLLDAATGRTRVRFVDTESLRYRIARRYMVRLERDDFADPDRLGRLAAACGLSAEAFRERFQYLTGRAS